MKFYAILTLIIALGCARTVYAHGGEPRLELGAERLNPGGTLEIRGVDFTPEEMVSLFLVGTVIKIGLGELAPDTEGGFLQLIELPADLPEGEYHIQAIGSDHDISSPAFSVAGVAISTGEEGEQRQGEEPLLAPMPTAVEAFVGNGQPTAAAVVVPVSESEGPKFIWAILLGGLILIGVVWIVAKRKFF